MRRIASLAATAAALIGWTTAIAQPTAQPAAGRKVLQMPLRTDGPKSLDPVEGSTQYDNIACSQIYETLLTFKYNSPRELTPNLAEAMPTTDDGGKTWTFVLKADARFHDSVIFPGGKGRAVVADDVFYSIKRLADKAYEFENWWLVQGTVLGFDEFKAAQNAALDAATPAALAAARDELVAAAPTPEAAARLRAAFDHASPGRFNYDAPVEGFVKVSDRELRFVLTRPVYRFLYTLAQFQTSVVPREGVEHYGKDWSFNPVGTGPFVIDRWVPKQSLTINRNPNYREEYYPTEWSAADRQMRLDRAAGRRIPFVDRMEFTMFVQDQPMWLDFRQGKLAYIEVPNDYFEEAFNKRTLRLKPELTREGIRDHRDLLLDFIFYGFNMLDPVVGGYDDRGRKLRQAINLAINLQEVNEAFYSGINVIYDGPIPPGLDGHPADSRGPVSYRGPNLERARALLAEAGYPEGRGLPPIRYYTSNQTINQPLSEMLTRQLAEVGIRLEPTLVDFSTLIENVNNRKAPFFGFAWGSDYPDGENNLALFYTPNASPGSNHYNYSRPEYDALYERILTMAPGPERTAIYEQMRDMIVEDAPYVGSMARTRFYLLSPWVLNCRPTERFWGWFKYLDVDDSKR